MKKLLTDKTLATFERWYYETHCKSSIKFEDLLLWQKSEIFDWLYSRCETIQYAFAVEFFDSVGIYISTISHSENEFWSVLKLYMDKKNYSNGVFIDRKYATAKAIEKANEIFNNRYF